MFDRAGAGDRLHNISKRQVLQFLSGPEGGDVYGVGFFCDAYDGSVYLVANTEQHHRASLHALQARLGKAASEVVRWDIGNWKYPGGLFPAASGEQREFDAAWEEHRGPLSEFESDQKQEMLEDLCSGVLVRLFNEGAFSTASGLRGLTVLGPDDREESVLEKKKRFDCLMGPKGGRPER